MTKITISINKENNPKFIQRAKVYSDELKMIVGMVWEIATSQTRCTRDIKIDESIYFSNDEKNI